MVCIVLEVPVAEFTQAKPDPEWRYFTLEKGDDPMTGEECTVLCAWEGDSHINYGDGAEPTPGAFLGAVTKLLQTPEAKPEATTHLRSDSTRTSNWSAPMLDVNDSELCKDRDMEKGLPKDLALAEAGRIAWRRHQQTDDIGDADEAIRNFEMAAMAADAIGETGAAEMFTAEASRLTAIKKTLYGEEKSQKV